MSEKIEFPPTQPGFIDALGAEIGPRVHKQMNRLVSQLAKANGGLAQLDTALVEVEGRPCIRVEMVCNNGARGSWDMEPIGSGEYTVVEERK